MQAKSFKQMIKDGDIKRADAMKVRLSDIHEEAGFNLRREGEDLQESIDALAAFVLDGGQLPPLEVRPRAEGGVYVVDGHRRRRALHQAISLGYPAADEDGELWVSVVAFNGNDADRVARVITSQEGRKLEPLELAEGYKRLAAFGWQPDRIAAKVGKTRQHVEQMLLLASANSDVQQLVASGAVAAATAVDLVRKHGENAGQVLAGELEKAKASGRAKVTAGTMKPWMPPAKVVAPLVDRLDAFIDAIPPTELQQLQDARNDPNSTRTVFVSAHHLNALVDEVEGLRQEREQAAKRQREKAAKAAQVDLVG